MNLKLNIKVLKQMDEDLINLEASLVNLKDEQVKIAMFNEARELRKCAAKLHEFYQKVLNRTLK
jgi:hypothetical protein